MTDGKTHYYFSKGTGRFLSVIAGKLHHITYTIEEVDEKERRMQIRITQAHSRILTFSPDKNEVSDIAEVGAIKAREAIKWRYVDNEQTPSSDVIKSTGGEEVDVEITTAPKRPEFIIGDAKGKIYYWRGCADYETLPMPRRVYFKTKRDAQRAGYKAARNCP